MAHSRVHKLEQFHAVTVTEEGSLTAKHANLIAAEDDRRIFAQLA